MAHRYSKRNEARESTRTNGDQGDVSPGIRTGRRENEENPNAMVYHKVSHEYKMPDPPPPPPLPPPPPSCDTPSQSHCCHNNKRYR